MNDGSHATAGSHSYVYDPENRITQVDSNGATYTYDAEGNRVRKDVSGSPSTEYVYSGGNVIAERDVTSGTWSDYIYAGGKRIAKSDNFEDRIHTHAVGCSTCTQEWYQFAFSNAGGLAGRVIQTGDKLMWRQWEASGTLAGIIMAFTDGTQNWSAGVNLTDQHGEGLQASNILGWNNRIGNLSPAAGKTISYFALVSFGGAGAWDAYYQDWSTWARTER
jgi:YD repeat-containing protein